LPFAYGVVPAVNFTTSATPNTEIDALFVAPKTAASGTAVRSVFVRAVNGVGKGAGLTALTGIVQRFKRWTTTASSGGTAITPQPRASGTPAALCTSGGATGGVTSGTGGPLYQAGFGHSATGPGQWSDLGDVNKAIQIDGNLANSFDVFNASGTASMVHEVTSVEIEEH